MNQDKYSRQVELVCPTCGGNRFETEDDTEETTAIIKCTSCDREFTKDELIRGNSENINKHILEIGGQATGDVAEELKESLKEAFRGNKYITIK
ncbi:hypothetical protein [Methanoculleus sp.]|uniref:ECs_2282 family putative zinc-binding protein n=1 Tax=Methanoculleus sp. TaxID=90427 RepID=UPI001BD1D870|nr:hypothetical protein [Methanoculleus sp.]